MLCAIARSRAPVRSAIAAGAAKGWRTVGQIDEFFARTCEAADAVFNEPAACRYFLNWFDDVPRAEMRRELLAEVTQALQSRQALAAA